MLNYIVWFCLNTHDDMWKSWSTGVLWAFVFCVLHSKNSYLRRIGLLNQLLVTQYAFTISPIYHQTVYSNLYSSASSLPTYFCAVFYWKGCPGFQFMAGICKSWCMNLTAQQVLIAATYSGCIFFMNLSIVNTSKVTINFI